MNRKLTLTEFIKIIQKNKKSEYFLEFYKINLVKIKTFKCVKITWLTIIFSIICP